ncbi:MAG: hypothetical protein ACLRFP_05185, partial [Alphaproteobacteria bacterium]
EFLRLGLIIGWQGAMLGLPRLIKPHFCGFFVGFPILSQVRKSGIKNRHDFAHLRTFKKKRLEI